MRMTGRRRGVGTKLTLGVATVLSCGVTACGSSSSSHSSSAAASASGSTNSTAASSTVASSGKAGACGTVKLSAPIDPTGVLKGLSPKYLANYDGYPYPVVKSAWANWKPTKTSGLVVGLIMNNADEPAQVQLLDSTKKDLLANPNISKVVVQVSNNSLPTQLQQLRSLVQQGVNLIAMQNLAGAPEVPLVEQAAKKGIPVIAMEDRLPTPDAVTVNVNMVAAVARQSAAVAAMMGGKGTLLEVQGFPGVSLNTETNEAFAEALKPCPNIKVAGNVVGDWSAQTAKSVVLQYLSTHPTTINGVLQSANMGGAAVSAFQETGRSLPVVNFNWAQQGELALWKQLKPKGLKAIGSSENEIATAQAVADVADRMFAGDGLKVSDVIAPMAPVTSANLDSIVSPSWSTSSLDNVNINASSYWPTAFLNELFTKQSKGAS